MANSNSREKLWYALDAFIEPAASEAVQYGMMEAGALGTEATSEQMVTAYFEKPPNRESIRQELWSALTIYSLPSAALRDISIREVENRDWLAEWKKSWKPVAVGKTYLIAPPWADVSDEEHKIVIRIEPGMAFGTGTHETTQLCLRAIESHFRGQSFLDVGTGTGILAIAAAKVAPNARVEAFDNDANAVRIAEENARLNGVDRISFHLGSIDDTTVSADFVCANLTTETILSMLPALVGATCGRLILSGILASQVDSIVSALQKLGISSQPKIETAGEWACVVV
ncbi:MAG TPA: 50S ribosomal protein L11 methyltransferase [Pyrinomonadaceae bacterium]|nr:50S ribosomal protein L11 methyltransferase [Pyrinomonadaceae bacterium]